MASKHIPRLYLSEVSLKTANEPYQQDKAFGLDVSSKNNPEMFHYIANVLRLQVGEEFICFNGYEDIDFYFTIKQITKNTLTAKLSGIKDKHLGSNLNNSGKITLCLCLLKKEQMSDAVRMATEIGVDEILFILSDYSKQHLKLFNYNKVVEVSISAASQCGLSIVPKIHQKPISIESLFLNNANLQPTSPCNIIVANESLCLGTKPSHLVNVVSNFKNKYKDVAILIGPEGGFSQEDNNIIRTNKLNVVEVSLGKNILRASTASTALLFLASIVSN